MDPERYQRIKQVFTAALACDTADRGDLLATYCVDDPELLVEVESLLKHDKSASTFIEQSAVEITARTIADKEFWSGKKQRIGPYRVVEEIGRGGMGVVYLAVRDDDQFQKQVAIKLIKRGMDTEAVVRRFRNERQILASLEHPHIARLIDGGTTDDGLPYFVLEYVEGEPLLDFCDRHKLSTQDRLHLFRKVCAAVQYAHQNLIVHRDLKPSNILVTETGEPKLLDFGIARLLHSDQSHHVTDLTGTEARAFTPQYASPEQIRGQKITTTSDVYSLGVVLYELLTGRRPYRAKDAPFELAKLVCEHDPMRPSTVVVHDTVPNQGKRSSNGSAADARSTQLHKLRRQLSGDLDNIVLMAMRKDPERRYSSVGQFSEDVRRHLGGLPVIARRDTFSYRASKFIKRNRVGVLAAVLIVASLIGGIFATYSQASVARQEKAKADEIKTFLERTLNYSNPMSNSRPSGDRDTTVTDVLNEAARRLEGGEFATRPELRAELEEIIARSYAYQGHYDLAYKHLAQVIEIHRSLYGENHPKTLVASAFKASLLFSDGNLDEAEKIYKDVLPQVRHEYRNGNVKPHALADALNQYAYLRRTKGDSKYAEQLFREALTLAPRIPTEERYIISSTRSTLASTLADQGKHVEALQTARESVSELRSQGDSPDLGFAFTILGGFLTEREEYGEADDVLNKAEAIFRQRLTPFHLWLGDNLRNQAISFCQQAKYDACLAKADETLTIYEKSFGTHYDHYPTALIAKGLSLSHLGQVREGEQALRKALDIRRRSLPTEHYWVAQAQGALGESLLLQKRIEEARPLLVDSYRTLERTQGADNPRTLLAKKRCWMLDAGC